MKKEAVLYEQISNSRVRCRLCAHACVIAPGGVGRCAVRRNAEGRLQTLVYGELAAAQIDPVEKKPFFHVAPGSRAYSIATVGCTFTCAFCQNWDISQAARPDAALPAGQRATPAEIVAQAAAGGCRSIAYTYTEPTVFLEYALDVMRAARERGVLNLFVTNGYMSAAAFDLARPLLDAANIDLKSFRESFYRDVCGARLAPVLETISRMVRAGVWVELTTLVIPGQNDSDAELKDIARFIASVGASIPWHISRFRPDYRTTDIPPTPLARLRRAYEIGREAGLRYVYLGNAAEHLDTLCPRCGELLIARTGMAAETVRLRGGACPQCGEPQAGLWE